MKPVFMSTNLTMVQMNFQAWEVDDEIFQAEPEEGDDNPNHVGRFLGTDCGDYIRFHSWC